MTTTTQTHEERAEALVGRIFQATLGAMDLGAIHLGERLGLYTALRDHGPCTSTELAAATRTHERYVREWLEQQAVTDILEVQDPAAPATERRYRLPDAHVEVLTDQDSLSYMPPMGRMTLGFLQPMDQLIEAFRTGDGVPYPNYGADTREGIAAMNRVMFLNQLETEWFPNIPDVHERLSTRPSRIADIGCGTASSSIALARTYPLAEVDAFDVDELSVAQAHENVAAAGLSDRIHVHRHDAGAGSTDGTYDLVTIFECLHDMARPVEALVNVRRMLAPEGSVVLADERVADAFVAPGDDVERLMYSCSVLHCLAVGIADHEDSAATGTVMRADTLRRYANEAGFPNVEILPIENDFWRFYLLRP